MTETLFGLETHLVRELIAGVAPVEHVQRSSAVDDVEDLGGSAEVAERFARAAWSCLAEPGDSGAGGLLTGLGGSAALTALIERWPAERAGRSAKAWARGLERWTPRLTSTDVVRALRTAARTGMRLLIPSDEHWPQGLIALGDHSPPALWLRGDPKSLRSLDKSIAIVGARASTGYGDHVAMESSAGLVDRGFAIVSGAANIHLPKTCCWEAQPTSRAGSYHLGHCEYRSRRKVTRSSFRTKRVWDGPPLARFGVRSIEFTYADS
jgi:hypothetical protein